MRKKKGIKRVIIITAALIVLFSTAKNLDIHKKNSIFEQMKGNQTPEKAERSNQENQLDIVNANESEDDIFSEISSKHEGVSVLLQGNQIQNDYYGYVINSITKSKELGDFQNPYDILEHVDEQGNTVGPYSYLIINMTIECYQEFPELYLNTLKIFLYKGVELARGYEALTSNNTIPMSSKSGMRAIMKKGELKNVNIVYLIDDEYIEDPDIDMYLYINNMGAALGDDIENKKLVKLDTKEIFQ